MAKDGTCGSIAVQAEETFSGAGAGVIFGMAGIREFQFNSESINRTTRVSIWREEASQARAGKFFKGRFDCEGSAVESLDLFIANLLSFESSANSPGFITRNYQVRRAAGPSVESLRFLLAYEGGPWVVLGGVVVSGIRFTIRGRMLLHVSVDFQAATHVQVDEDPGWEIVRTVETPLKGMFATPTLDDVIAGEMIEVSLGIDCRLQPTDLDEDGVVGRFIRSGPTTVSGALTEYGGGTELEEAVRDGAELDFELVMNDGTDDRLTVSVPRLAPQAGQPGPIGRSDVVTNIGWRGMSGCSILLCMNNP